MGNSKSRPAGTKSRGKHSKLPGSGRSSKQSHANQQQPLPNDSGHYSIHGFMASSSSPIDRPETPVGGGGPGSGTGLPGVVGSLPWNHPNMSSPGRLDQQEKTSDSSLHFQYSSKVKHGAAPNPATAGTNGHIHSHETSLRTSGLGSRATMVLGIGAGEEAAAHGYSNTNTIHNTPSSQEMMMSMHHQQPQPLYQGADPRPSSASPHQSHGRTSTFHPNHTQQQQQQQQQRPMQAPVPPSTVPFLEDENATENAPGGSLGGVVSSVAAMNLGDGRVPNGTAQHQQIIRLQQQQQYQQQLQQQHLADYGDHHQRQASTSSHPLDPTVINNNNNRNSMLNSYQGPNGTAPYGNTANSKSNSNPHYHHNESSYPYAQPDQYHYQLQQQQQQQQAQLKQQQQQQQQYQAQPRLTTTYPSERDQRPPAGANFGKPADALANAGPLIDSGSSLQRPPTVDQVFARLAKQFPTNPRETEKRERIYRWLDQIAEALTFNPDPETPGWIIPVYADELDHPESPFYLDRVTYELDLMAPVGKPFRKVIDINCSSGEWAMDMALKYPRTIVYALDPLLDIAHLPLRIPENCKFRMRDVRDQEGEFDLVHQRLGAFRTQIQEWTPHFAELRRLTRPGGWIQLAESNGLVLRAGVESLKVNRWVEQAALSSGLNPIQMVEALMPTILGAGLINVECFDYGIPIGDWAGPRGQVAMRSYLEMVESLREEIIEMNRLEEGIFEETIELMKMECVAEKAELVMKVLYAQKPPITDDLWRTR